MKNIKMRVTLIDNNYKNDIATLSQMLINISGAQDNSLTLEPGESKEVFIPITNVNNNQEIVYKVLKFGNILYDVTFAGNRLDITADAKVDNYNQILDNAVKFAMMFAESNIFNLFAYEISKDFNLESLNINNSKYEIQNTNISLLQKIPIVDTQFLIFKTIHNQNENISRENLECNHIFNNNSHKVIEDFYKVTITRTIEVFNGKQ